MSGLSEVWINEVLLYYKSHWHEECLISIVATESCLSNISLWSIFSLGPVMRGLSSTSNEDIPVDFLVYG